MNQPSSMPSSSPEVIGPISCCRVDAAAQLFDPVKHGYDLSLHLVGQRLDVPGPAEWIERR